MSDEFSSILREIGELHDKHAEHYQNALEDGDEREMLYYEGKMTVLIAAREIVEEHKDGDNDD